MSENVDINLTTYNRAQFTKAVNTSFTEFGVTGEPEPSIVSQIDINTFFEAYNALFLEIPKQGGTQSHQYLANRSGEYAGGEDINAEIGTIVLIENNTCDVCKGYGWYADHSHEHHMRPDLDCSDCGCPIQRECETCQGEGFLLNNFKIL